MKDFIPLGFDQFLFNEDSALSSLSPSAEEANLLQTSQIHHVNNIYIAPIGLQNDEEPSNHFVIHTQGRLNVPLLDMLLPQEGAPLIIHLLKQLEPAPLPKVSCVFDPSITFLLPAKNKILYDVSPILANPQITNHADGIQFNHHFAQFPEAEIALSGGLNLFNAITPPPMNTLGGITPLVRP